MASFYRQLQEDAALGGTDILVFPPEYLKEKGLFLGDKVVLRGPSTRARECLATIGWMRIWEDVSTDAIVVGPELHNRIAWILESLEDKDEDLQVLPFDKEPHRVQAHILVEATEDTDEAGRACQADLQPSLDRIRGWLRERKAVNLNFPYRLETGKRVVFVGEAEWGAAQVPPKSSSEAHCIRDFDDWEKRWEEFNELQKAKREKQDDIDKKLRQFKGTCREIRSIQESCRTKLDSIKSLLVILNIYGRLISLLQSNDVCRNGLKDELGKQQSTWQELMKDPNRQVSIRGERAPLASGKVLDRISGLYEICRPYPDDPIRYSDQNWENAADSFAKKVEELDKECSGHSAESIDPLPRAALLEEELQELKRCDEVLGNRAVEWGEKALNVELAKTDDARKAEEDGNRLHNEIKKRIDEEYERLSQEFTGACDANAGRLPWTAPVQEARNRLEELHAFYRESAESGRRSPDPNRIQARGDDFTGFVRALIGAVTQAAELRKKINLLQTRQAGDEVTPGFESA